jgi:hypothetical protein
MRQNFKDMASVLMSYYQPQQGQQVPPRVTGPASVMGQGAGHHPLQTDPRMSWGRQLQDQLRTGFEPGQRVDNPAMYWARGLG